MSIIKTLRKEIAERQILINRIQEECSHPSSCVEKKAGSATGDPYSTNSYWYDCECKLCRKRWKEDQ